METEPKALQAESVSKKDSNLRRRLIPGIIGILVIVAIFLFWIIGAGSFPTFGTASQTIEPTNSPQIIEPIATLIATETITAITAPPQDNSTLTQQPSVTQTPTVTFTVTSLVCDPLPEKSRLPGNVAHFVSETISPGSVLPPNQIFEKTWTIRNVGATTWTPKYSIAVGPGNSFGSNAPENFSSTVEPGGCIDITITRKAPSDPGNYNGSWVLLDENQNRFNFDDTNRGTLDIVIVIPKPPATPTPIPGSTLVP